MKAKHRKPVTVTEATLTCIEICWKMVALVIGKTFKISGVTIRYSSEGMVPFDQCRKVEAKVTIYNGEALDASEASKSLSLTAIFEIEKTEECWLPRAFADCTLTCFGRGAKFSCLDPLDELIVLENTFRIE